MACTTLSATLLGVDARLVEVEVDVVKRLPGMVIVGLPASSVREASERVRSAITASGLDYPKRRVTVNLAPADLRKGGTGLDLPIALGVLAANDCVGASALDGRMFFGELGLDGELRAVPGALAVARLAATRGVTELVLPTASAGRASLVPGLRVLAADNLAQVACWANGEGALPEGQPELRSDDVDCADLADVRGQPQARRALEIAAAGGHNLLMVGSPGMGKTMLAARLPSILPRMSFDEALEATQIHSVAGLLPPSVGLLERRPFRAPHHSVSAAGLVGGANLRPGEACLAHRGVLFLDEVPEFSRRVLEQLRAPLEDRRIVLCRAAGTVVFPAAFALVAAANPCPCGHWGHPRLPCRCSDHDRGRYLARISGPLMDRIDLHVGVDNVEADELVGGPPGEPSAKVRARVERARQRQRERGGTGLPSCNAELSGAQIRSLAETTSRAESVLRDAVDRLSLSGRGCDRVLKLARTLADLDAEPRVDTHHVAEALSFRPQLVRDALC